MRVDERQETGPPTIGERLDRLPAGRWLWRMVALISLGAFFEIYDVSLSAPLSLGLAKAGIFHAQGLFGLSDQATFIAATFAGLWLGALAFSAIADRFGRRPIFAAALLWYALATLVMGLQSSAVAIDAWRLAASIGVGVELVAIDCYLAELAPKAVRGRVFAVSSAIQFLSAPALALLAWAVIPGVRLGIDGWRWLAFAPGLGAVLAWRARRWLPESPRWLAGHGRKAEAEAVTASFEALAAAELQGPLPAPTPEPPALDQTAMRLFRPPLRQRVLTLIAFHLFQTLGYYGFFGWLPTLLVAQGVTLPTTLAYSVMPAIVPPLAPLVFTAVADRVERKWLIVAGALTAALFGLLMAGMTRRADLALYTVIGAMTAAGASLMSLAYHAYQSELFPTPVRARAVGLVYSFSRLSAAGAAYLIAAVLARFGPGAVFALIAGAMGIVSLIIGLTGPPTRGLALEEI